MKHVIINMRRHWTVPIIVSILILVSFSIPSFAQVPVTFSGTITDRDGTPAPDQQVHLSDGSLFFNSVTDANGLFSVLAAPGTYSLAVNAAGSGLPAKRN